MSVLPIPIFDPKQSADFDAFTLKFDKWLQQGESVVSASATANSSDLDIVAVVVQSPYVTLWLSGGTSGSSYTLMYSFQTSSGRSLNQPASVTIN